MALIRAETALALNQQAIETFVVSTSDTTAPLPDRATPPELRSFLAGLRLLQSIPFAYLAPDSALLPTESIRFFYLDRAWTDAVVQGALSVGTVNSSDRAQLEKMYPTIRDEIDEEERLVRLPGGEAVQQGPAGLVTGFLLRSRAVAGWPGLHVRAYSSEPATRDDEIIPESDPRRIKVLRMERLAPAVLLVLLDGLPAVVHIEEPRQGVQFGVREFVASGSPNALSATVPARDTATSSDVEVPPNSGNKVPVTIPFRSGSPGVVDMKALVANFVAEDARIHVGSDLDSAELALQMIRFPYRQVFGDQTLGGGEPSDFVDVFRPQIGLALTDLVARFQTEVGP
jgi:hypothetical protein